MGYYAGGYYAGGYYAGGIFGSIGKVLGGAVTGFFKGGPIGAIGGAIGGTVGAIRGGIAESTLAAGDTGSAYTPALRAKHAAALARGGALGGSLKPNTALPGAGLPAGFGGIPMVPGPGGAFGMVRGLRPNKSTYVTRGGGTSRWGVGLQVHPKHTELVKGRRMNVGNARALRRALRRAQGFAKLARRVIAVSHRFKKSRGRKARR